MQAKMNAWVQYAIAVMFLVGLFGFFYNAGEQVECPNCPEVDCPAVNNSDVINAIGGVQDTLDEDDNWKDIAKEIATDEWEARDYKEIYKALDDLKGDIDDRDDISRVVVKDEEVISFDVDDEDAVVVQEVKVYYEDLDGDDKKVYLTITTEIDEGEVENVDIELG